MITNLVEYTESQREATNSIMAFADAVLWANTVAYPICIRPNGVKMWFDFTRNTKQEGVSFESYEEALDFFNRRHKGTGLQGLKEVFAKCKEILPKHQQPEEKMQVILGQKWGSANARSWFYTGKDALEKAKAYRNQYPEDNSIWGGSIHWRKSFTDYWRWENGTPIADTYNYNNSHLSHIWEDRVRKS